MSDLVLRAATTADVDDLVDLLHAAYRGDSSRQGWTTEADLLDGGRTTPAEVRACIERPRSAIVVAERPTADGSLELVACAHVAVEGGAGYFGMFAVRPTLQGGGIGKVLLAEAERVARHEWGQSTMRMTVIDARTELLAFYERRGYRRTGETSPFDFGDEDHGIPKVQGLKFETLEKHL
jgi:GNAT superfamily N-acetyltransferase